MIEKISVRLFNNIPVRAKWDESTAKWWYSAVDLINVIVDTANARKYWNVLKRRNQEILYLIKQTKLLSSDGKKYLTDVIDEEGIKSLLLIIPNKNNTLINNWLKGMLDPIDEQSKKKALEMYENNLLDLFEVGSTKGLQQIHSYIFGGLYVFAGQIRNKNISKKGFMFANALFLNETLQNIDLMPENNLKEIVKKYIEMNIAHPFLEGNGRATRIWLDLILKKNLRLCVDWSKINKKDYLAAMEESSQSISKIYELIKSSLTNQINDRELFMKGIDYSYYYEEVEEL